jgi:flagellar biosynthesis/type III secretory pathway protein FliH
LCGLALLLLFLDDMVSDMDDNNDRRPSLEETLARSAELMAESERLLAPSDPQPEYVPQWTQPPSRYRGFEVETLDDMLKAHEAKINRRLAEFEQRLKVDRERALALAEALADEAGCAAGRLEKTLREENTAYFAKSLKAFAARLRFCVRRQTDRRKQASSREHPLR